jgi:hypothetical protein
MVPETSLIFNQFARLIGIEDFIRFQFLENVPIYTVYYYDMTPENRSSRVRVDVHY